MNQNIVFYSLITVIDIYRSELLIDLGVSEEQFSMIFAVLALIGGISLTYRKTIEKKLKNRTLAFLSIMYIISCILIGCISILYKSQSIVPLILIMYAIMRISTSMWYILEYKYLKNFTKQNIRNKLTFSYEFIGSISASICSILGGLLLNLINVEKAFLIVGLFSFVCMILTLDYMRTRFGLKPEEYSKQDIDFE